MTDASELARLDMEIDVLTARAEEARQVWAGANANLTAALQRRYEVARRVQPQQDVAPPSPPVAPPPPTDAHPAPETSAHTVQNVLFILGGLLLGTAAVVFTAVAWATFGVVGRAVILAVVTALALATPLVALRRGLSATAETFAGVGLLLVILDGYAGWAVNLFGVRAFPAAQYAGLVCLVTAIVAAGYRALTRLVGPGFVAVAAIQPVLPLLAVRLEPSASGWSLVAVGVAAINLAIVWRSRGNAVLVAVLRGLCWFLYGAALTLAVSGALVAQAWAVTGTDAATAGGALMVAASVLVTGSALTRSDVFRSLAWCVFVLAAIAAAGRFVAVVWPGYSLVMVAAVVAGTAALAVAGARLLPGGARPGPVAGAVVGAGVLATVLFAMAVTAAVDTVARTLPLWRATLMTEPRFDWQLLAALVLTALALLTVVPRPGRSDVVLASAALVVLALPDSIRLTWWGPSVVDVVAVTVLAAIALVASSPRARILACVSAAVLTVHGVLAGLTRPENTAAILGVLVVVGVTVGIVGYRQAIGGWATLVGLLALPPAVGAALLTPDVAAAVPAWWAARWTVAAAAVGLAGVFAARRWWPDLAPYAFWAGLISAVVWPAVVAISGVEPVGIYGAISLLLIATALVCQRGAATTPAGLATVPGALLLASDVLPAVLAVVVLPYTWVGEIWSGVPAGVGLAPPGQMIDKPFVTTVHAVALALLAVAAATAAYALTRRVSGAVAGLGVGGPSAILVALVAAGAPWPTVPAVTLTLGLLLTALAATVHIGQWSTAVTTVQGLAYVGAGLAGALTVEWATIASLGSTVVVAAVVGAAGRTIAWRVCGWIAAVAAALATAAAAGLAADLRVRDTAFTVLAVAVVALVLGAALREHRAESTAVQAAAHAGAVVALLFTVGWVGHAAAVCTIWGVAVGLRALWPDTSRSGRAALAALAAGWELLAWWLLLADRGVTLVEAYTLPLAAVGLLAGWAALRARPELRSWVAYGPALCAAFLPTLAIVLSTPASPERRLLLGAGALAVVVAGSLRRRQAPVVVAGSVLVIVALRELVAVWDLLPRWIPLAVGGLLLVGIAMTYERRRRDMARLRDAVGRMT